MTPSPDSLIDAAANALAAVRQRSPRIQCLTNTVAQQITANVLLAVGARVSMATHPDEVAAMSASADAVLINLGTLDEPRVAAIPRLLSDPHVMSKPRVLDPVFVEHSPLRLALARQIVAAGALIVKGNACEMAALDLPRHATRIVTGQIDRIAHDGAQVSIDNGHPFMALVTGLGCAAGALAAGFASVERDALRASVGAMAVFGIAGEMAARSADGPGSFAVAFIDAIAAMDEAQLRARARITVDA